MQPASQIKMGRKQKYLYDCFCHHYSTSGPPTQSLSLMCATKTCRTSSGWSVSTLLGALIPSGSSPTLLYGLLRLSSSYKQQRVSLPGLRLSPSEKESWANKGGKSHQGKSLGSFSDMGEALPFHCCSLRFFSQLRQDSSILILSRSTENNTLAVFFLHSDHPHIPAALLVPE